MTSWQIFISEIQTHLDDLKAAGCTEPYFRGHADGSWSLLPGISREIKNPRYNLNKEKRLFWEFRMRGSHLLPANISEWTVLYYMQHYGLPTRLLDWTNAFASALYFALDERLSSPCIWILNPYDLNSMTIGRSISNLNASFKTDYLAFLDLALPGAIAADGDSSIDRMHAQRGSFTIHGDLTTPLDVVAPAALKRFAIPIDAIEDARKFLELAGTNHFSIFPDLAGLSREIRRKELS